MKKPQDEEEETQSRQEDECAKDLAYCAGELFKAKRDYDRRLSYMRRSIARSMKYGESSESVFEKTKDVHHLLGVDREEDIEAIADIVVWKGDERA